jgi:regulator of replication initiation timing
VDNQEMYRERLNTELSSLRWEVERLREDNARLRGVNHTLAAALADVLNGVVSVREMFDRVRAELAASEAADELEDDPRD